MSSPVSGKNVHLLGEFDTLSALNTLHGELDGHQNRWAATVEFINGQPSEVSSQFQSAYTIEGMVPRSGIFTAQMIGFILMQRQGKFTRLSAASLQSPAATIKDILGSPDEYLALKKAQIKVGCPGYFEVAKHVTTKHLTPATPIHTWWAGFIEAYGTVNRQLAIEAIS